MLTASGGRGELTVSTPVVVLKGGLVHLFDRLASR